MENEEAKHSGVLGTVSKCAGAGLGTVAKVGGTVKNLLTRPVDDFVPDINEDEQAEVTPQTPVLEAEAENTVPKADELADKVTTMETELVETRNLLAEAKSHAEKMQSEFASQLNTLQTERESLIFDLEQATKEVNESKSIEATLRARVDALESELDGVKSKAEKPHSPLIHAKPQFLPQVPIAQVEQEPLLSERQEHKIAEPVEEKIESSTEATTAQESDQGEAVIEETLSQSSIDKSDIPVLEEVEDVEAEQGDLPEQDAKQFATVQTEQEIEPLIETTAIQSDGQKQVETKAQEFGPVIAETSSSVPADVTIKEVNAADFDSATEKIIFINALSGISSPDKAIRVDAVKVMAGIRHELSARALVGQMAKEPAVQVRAECIKALAALNMKEGLPAIERALSEEAVSVRLAAVRGLYRLGGVTSAPELIRMLCDENEDIRRRTVTCIGWLGKEELAVELVPLLDDSSVSVRLAAVEAMGNLRSRKVVSALIEHLNDPEKIIRKAIISALKTITGKKMSGPFPRDEKSLQILIIRWRQWWEDEHKVLCHT